MLKKLRALIGNALMWGLGWAVVGAAPGILLAFAFPVARAHPLRIVGTAMAVFGIAGAASGTLFSLTLKVVYGRKHLDELRPARVGLWAMGGAMLVAAGALALLDASGTAFGLPVAAVMVPAAGAFGWATGAGATRIAQRSGGGALESGGWRELDEGD